MSTAHLHCYPGLKGLPPPAQTGHHICIHDETGYLSQYFSSSQCSVHRRVQSPCSHIPTTPGVDVPGIDHVPEVHLFRHWHLHLHMRQLPADLGTRPAAGRTCCAVRGSLPVLVSSFPAAVCRMRASLFRPCELLSHSCQQLLNQGCALLLRFEPHLSMSNASCITVNSSVVSTERSPTRLSAGKTVLQAVTCAQSSRPYRRQITHLDGAVEPI